MQHSSAITKKILNLQEAIYLVRSHQLKGLKAGFTNGCFDLLHRGHVAYLEAARQQCDVLLVGLNSDESVKRQEKGPDRPVNSENDRAFVLSGLVSVDGVVVFNEDTPLHLIEQIQPDILFKGGDYDTNETDKKSKKYIVGSESVLRNGGKVVTIPFVEGYSTTSMLAKAGKTT